LIEAIETKSEETFVKKVGAYVKITPIDKVKNQLAAKVKEVHVPEETKVAGVINKLNQLDFTCAGEDDEPVPKVNKPKKPALDFT